MSWGFWFNYAFALLVVGLMLVGLWVVVRGLARGRVLSGANRRMVSVLESTMLTQHVSVHVVKAGQRYLLVGGGNNGTLTTLAELPPDEVEAWLAQERKTLGQAGSLMEAWRSLRGRP
jgi:flagellar biogenesis protein FliO